MIILHFSDLGTPFFPGGPELWHHQLAYSAAGKLIQNNNGFNTDSQYLAVLQQPLNYQVQQPYNMPR